MHAERSGDTITIALTEEDMRSFDSGGELLLDNPPVSIHKYSKMLPSGDCVPEDYFDSEANTGPNGRLDINVPMREFNGKLNLPIEIINSFGRTIIVAAGNS